MKSSETSARNSVSLLQDVELEDTESQVQEVERDEEEEEELEVPENITHCSTPSTPSDMQLVCLQLWIHSDQVIPTYS